MQQSKRWFEHAWFAYFQASVVVGFFMWVRAVLQPLLNYDAPLVTLNLAVIICAWLWGVGPGVMATTICTLISSVFFLNTYKNILDHDYSDLTRLVLFVTQCMFVCWLIYKLRRLTDQAQASASIVERQRAELQSSEEQFRSFFETAAVGMAQIDLQYGHFRRVNDAMCQITGYDHTELANLNLCQITHIDDQEATRKQLHEMRQYFAQAVSQPLIAERRFIRKDGRNVWVSLSVKGAQPDKQADDKSSGHAIVIIQDITARKEAEDKLVQAKNIAEAASRAKTQFLANISHEIRTPLGVILGFSEFLRDPQQPQADRLHCVDTIHRNGELLKRVIEDVLDLAKIEASHVEIECEEIVLSELLDYVRSLARWRADEKGIELGFRTEGFLPRVIFTDGSRLKQILINIIGNAIKFTAQGRVDVRLRAITPETAHANMILEFDVKDSGIGISAEQQQSLFQPFTQADNTLTRRFGGTGLGLAIAQRLSKALGGSVEILKSALGEGSTFRIRIDAGCSLDESLKQVSAGKTTRVQGAVATKSMRSNSLGSGSPAHKRELEGVRVLIVEDAQDNQLLISKLLRSSGAVVGLASNGIECLEIIEKEEFDVILMDIQMPKLDGRETTIHLRAHGYKKPIVALTAHAMKAEREETMRLGFNDYLTKPVDFSALIAIVVKYVQKQSTPQAVADTESPSVSSPPGSLSGSSSGDRVP